MLKRKIINYIHGVPVKDSTLQSDMQRNEQFGKGNRERRYKMSREMKDSGIAWIGEIPKEWDLRQGKFLMSFLSGFPADSKFFTLDSSAIPLIRIRDINNSETEVYYNGIFPDEYLIKNGDILIGMDGDFNIAIWKGKNALLNQRVCKIIKSHNYVGAYSFYVMSIILNWINDLTYGTTVKHLSTKDILNSKLPVPPLTEQKAIAEYLDMKCGEIDELISLQDKMIEELKAYKQSIITETVTRGLNPDAPLKDSGIEWIGEIPEHWKICKLKYAIKLLNGRAYLQHELLSEGKYRILRVGNLFTNESWYYSSLELEPDKYCEKGDLLYAWSASIGPYIWEGDRTIYHYHIWKIVISEKLIKSYSYYLLHALTQYKLNDMHGSAMQHLTKSKMDNSIIPIPPLSEQQEIADYLDKKCAEIDNLISLKQQKIEELKEFKKSLIYEYVTGKKQVGTWRAMSAHHPNNKYHLHNNI